MDKQLLCWHGKVNFKDDNKIIIRNYISQYQHELIFLAHQNEKILDCKTSWYHVYVLFSNGNVYQIPWSKKLDHAVVRLDYANSYKWTEENVKISISTVTRFDEEEKFSHFGLRYTKKGREVEENSNNENAFLLACTEKFAYFVDNTANQWKLFRLNDDPATPVGFTFGDLPNVKIDKICAGNAHVIMLDSYGCVYSFGVGTKGELGHGSSDCQDEPKLVENLGGLKIRSISAGGWHSAAITECGDMYVWGWNNNGQLGIDKEHVSVIFEPTFVDINKSIESEEINFKSVSCGSTFTLALTETGDLYFSGQYKIGISPELINESTSFVKIENGEKVVYCVEARDWSAQIYYN